MELYILGALKMDKLYPTPIYSQLTMYRYNISYISANRCGWPLKMISQQKTLTVPAWLNDRALAKEELTFQLYKKHYWKRENNVIYHQLLSKKSYCP